MNTINHPAIEGQRNEFRKPKSGGSVRLVVKFGGTSVANGERIEQAADNIAAAVEAGHEVAVVVSAMGGTTDLLLDSMEYEASDEDRAEIVSMGERTSVRILKGALDARGIGSDFYEPGSEDWPIVTDEHGEVDVEESQKRSHALAGQLKDVVPVITGFLAQDRAGNITTLGRGGSDTTAVMLGNYMDADEVLIVTDVEGVMTGDPHVVEGARNVGEITVDELRSLSFRGAEVVAPSALSYKDGDMDVRVVHYQHDDLLAGGTAIEGEFENLIDLHERELDCITVAGRAIRHEPGVLSKLSSALAEEGMNVQTVSSGMDSVTFYVDDEHCEEAEAILHDEVVEDDTLSSVTVEQDIAVIRVTGGNVPNNYDTIKRILDPLADEHIYLYDVITSASSVAVFVPWDQRETVLDLVQGVFE
jgi:aspartate kinase